MPAMFLSMSKLSTQALQMFYQQIFPPACPICQNVTEPMTKQMGCCASCLNSIEVMPQDFCQYCGIPMPPSLAPGPCGTCLKSQPPQQHTQTLFIYKGAVRQALLAWKLQGQNTGITWLLNTSNTKLQHIFSAKDLLIPVPMPLHRMRRSGLHHSADLCKHIANITKSKIDWRLLRRTGTHIRQSSLQGRDRQNNLRKAFALSDDYQNRFNTLNIKGRVWVVDDILTTGATLRHACHAMRLINQPIFAFSLARTLQD